MILATRTGANRRVANLDAFLSAIDTRRGGSSSALAVTNDRVVGIAACNLAIRIASTAIAELGLAVYRGEELLPQTVKGTWQARYFAGMPNAYESWSLLLEQTEASITARNNAFWRLDRDLATGRVVGSHFLHPDAVEARWSLEEDRPVYRYRLAAGRMSDWTTTSILHFRVGYVDPGCIIAPSPIELHRDELGGMLSSRRHSRNLWERGAPQQIAVTYPEKVDREKAQRTRAKLDDSVGTGPSAAGRVRVFGAGAQVTTIGLSMRDAQWAEGVALDVHTAGQIFGVPATMMMAQSGERVSVPEHEQTRWDRLFLGPRRTRIQDAILAHPAFFGPGARDWPALRAPKIRADVRTESAAIVADVQAGILTPDEARALKGYGPHTTIDGSIPQFTPVGGAPNPAGMTPSPDAVPAGELDPTALVVPAS